ILCQGVYNSKQPQNLHLDYISHDYRGKIERQRQQRPRVNLLRVAPNKPIEQNMAGKSKHKESQILNHKHPIRPPNINPPPDIPVPHVLPNAVNRRYHQITGNSHRHRKIPLLIPKSGEKIQILVQQKKDRSQEKDRSVRSPVATLPTAGIHAPSFEILLIVKLARGPAKACRCFMNLSLGGTAAEGAPGWQRPPDDDEDDESRTREASSNLISSAISMKMAA
ncbi:N-acetyldiaminopimelate deacetylase, partial [Striga asiatica]